METSSQNEARSSSLPPGTEASGSPHTSIRKSGRTTRKPNLYSDYSEVNARGGSKRKRVAPRDGEEENEENTSEPDSEEEEDGTDSGEERIKVRRKAVHKVPTKRKVATKSKGKSHATHAAKKPKISANGVGKQLALRPATNGKPAAPKNRKPIARPSLAADVDGLYGMLLSSDVGPGSLMTM